MASGLLSHTKLLELYTAAVSARLPSSRDALLAGLAPAFVASLPYAASPAEQILRDLDALNSVGTLVDGTVPLAVWLGNAVTLAGPRPESNVFHRALLHVTGGREEQASVPISAPPCALKILFLGANPAGTTRLALDHEVREITGKLRATPHGARFEFVQEWAVRVSDLQAALLRHRPQIVHFSGHGRDERIRRSASSADVTREMLPPDEPSEDERGGGEILVENDAGGAQPIPTFALAELFGLVGGVRCVVLNACHSAAQAEAIGQHVDAVVSMSRSIRDAAAIHFAWAFYQGLGFGESLSKAFELGKNQIGLAGLGDGEVPRLLTREPTSGTQVLGSPE